LVKLDTAGGITTGTITFNNGDPSPYDAYGTVDLNTKSPSWNGLAGGGGTVKNGNATLVSTLTIGGTSTSSSFGGTIITSTGDIKLIKTGTGTFTLSADNTYGGNTAISGGELQLTGSGTLSGTPLISISPGASFDANGFSVGSGKTLHGTGAAGTIKGGLTLASGATLLLNYASLNPTDNPTLTVASSTLTLDPGNTITITNTGALLSPGNYKLISSSGGAVAISGSLPTPAIYLASDGSQGWSGTSVALRITSGELWLDITGHTPTTLKWSGGGGTWNKTLTNWKDSVPNDVAFFDTDTVVIDETYSSAGGTITVGEVVLPTAMTVSNDTSGYTITGSSIGGTPALTKQGTHTLTLSSANAFSGETRIIAGVLTLGHGSAMQNSGLNLATGDSGDLHFASSLGTATIGGLKGSRNLVLNDESSNGVTVTVGGNNASTTYLGILSGAGGFTKVGTGTFTLGDALANQATYSGDTTISGGTLYIAKGEALSGNVALSSSATLDVGPSAAISIKGLSGGGGTFTKTGSSTLWNLTLGNGDTGGSFSGQIQNGSALMTLTKTGSGTQTLSGINSIGGTGGTTINGGRLRAADGLALGALSCTVNAATLEIVNVSMSTQLGMTLNNGATLMASGTGTYGKSGSPSIASGASVTFSTVGSGDTLNLGSAITGGDASSMITAAGPGTIALTSASASSFNGKWKLTGGTLKLSSAGSLGASGTRAVELAGGTLETLVVAGADYSTATTVSASATIKPNSTGATHNDDYGLLSINNSTLNVIPGTQPDDNATSQVTFGATTLSGDATINVTKNGLKLAKVVLGAVGETGGTRKLTKAGDDRLQLDGAGTFTGGVTLSAGQLNINHATALGTGTFTISGVSIIANTLLATPLTLTTDNPQAWNADFSYSVGFANSDLNLGNGAVTLDGNRLVTVTDHKLTVGGNIGDGGTGYTLTKAGNGALALSGVSTYTGATTVSGGTLLVNSPGSLAAGSAVTVDSGATLGGTGTIHGQVTVNGGGILAPGASIGTLTLTLAPSLSATSTNLMEINRTNTPNADKLSVSTGGGVLALNGTLTVVNIGPALLAGDTFDLFDDPDGISGTFSVTNLPALDPGLGWNTSQLTVNGTITVDSVCMPATVNAGPDQTVCASSPIITLAGTFTGATNATWSGGAGGFSPNNTTTNASYTPTAGEITAGTVTLTLTTDVGDTCGSVNDSMTITIDPTATANAGPDQTVCADNAIVTLAGSFGGAATSATWSGAGTFTPDNLTLTATYTPTAGEISAGTATVTLTTDDPAGLCGAALDTMVVTINALPAISDQPTNLTVCASSPAIFTVGATGAGLTYQWQVSGDAGVTFTNISDTATNASYTNLVTTLADTGYQYQVIVSGTCSPSATSAPPAVLTVNAPTTANAGPDQTVCADSPTVTLAGAFGGAATSATWSGAGTFTPDNLTLTATYTPTAGEITAGTATVTLTTDDPAGPCDAASDTMVITINAVATANAGPDQTVSAGSPTVTLAGTIGGAATSATWSGGAGTFNPDNVTLTATYTPTAGEITAGSVTLTLTTDDPTGPCGAANDSMTITIASLGSVTITSIGGTSIAYTGGTGAQFVLLKSANVTAPLSGWSRETTNAATPGTFTIPAVGTGGDTVFYSIKSE
jgi:autotransporter-associated beta strand protein